MHPYKQTAMYLCENMHGFIAQATSLADSNRTPCMLFASPPHMLDTMSEVSPDTVAQLIMLSYSMLTGMA